MRPAHTDRLLQMRVVRRLCYRVRTMPAASIQPAALRLPPNIAPTSTKAPKRGLPTAEKLLAQADTLPANLRLDDYVPPRELYAGVSEADRNLVRIFQLLHDPSS